MTSGTDEAVDLATVVEDHCRQRADSVNIDFVITAETTTVSAPRTAIDRWSASPDNAVKHGRSPVRVRLETRPEFAVLEVVDSGAGMDPATLATAPERFFRAPEARGRKAQGLAWPCANRCPRCSGRASTLLQRCTPAIRSSHSGVVRTRRWHESHPHHSDDATHANGTSRSLQC